MFISDVRDYFKASLATSEYENTSNMFYLTASESTEQLLNRCECLLNRLSNKNQKITNGNNTFTPLQNNRDNGIKQNPNSMGIQRNSKPIEHEDVSYLDMSANHYSNNGKSSK